MGRGMGFIAPEERDLSKVERRISRLERFLKAHSHGADGSTTLPLSEVWTESDTQADSTLLLPSGPDEE